VVAAADGDPLTPLLQAKADAVIAGLSVGPGIQRKIDFSRAYASVSHGSPSRARPPVRPAGAGDTLSLSLEPGDAAAMIAALRKAFAGKTIAAAPGTPDRAFLAAHFGDIATVPTMRPPPRSRAISPPAGSTPSWRRSSASSLSRADAGRPALLRR